MIGLIVVGSDSMDPFNVAADFLLITKKARVTCMIFCYHCCLRKLNFFYLLLTLFYFFVLMQIHVSWFFSTISVKKLPFTVAEISTRNLDRRMPDL